MNNLINRNQKKIIEQIKRHQELTRTLETLEELLNEELMVCGRDILYQSINLVRKALEKINTEELIENLWDEGES